MAKEMPDGYEDLRRPENRSPLREVAVKLLVPRRSSLHIAFPNSRLIAPLPITSSHLRRRDLRSSDLSPRAALVGLAFSCTASVPVLFQRASQSPPIKRCSSSPAASITYSLTTNQRAPRSQKWAGAEVTSRTAWIKSPFLPGFCLNELPAVGSSRHVTHGRRCCRTRRMESKSINFPSSSPPLDSSPRSRRTEEVARWEWSRSYRGFAGGK